MASRWRGRASHGPTGVGTSDVDGARERATRHSARAPSGSRGGDAPSHSARRRRAIVGRLRGVSDDVNPSAEESKLRRRFRVIETDVAIGGKTISILHPESAEDLIDERDFDLDERLPYWAELWPSARALAEHMGRLAGGGASLLELGCGAGLVSTSAALAGFAVTASDYYE